MQRDETTSAAALNVAPAVPTRDADPLQALRFRRLHVGTADEGTLAGRHILGGRWIGLSKATASQAPKPDVDLALQSATGGPLAARLLWHALAAEQGIVDLWSSAGDVVTKRHGCIQYATDGAWLHGLAEIDEPVDGHDGGLQAAARRLYTDLFELLSASPCPHLLRLWNYFAGINREADGSERYRQFNAGRQQAFFEAGRSAFEGSPAASALGTQAGPLRVYFLAGRTPPVAIENPRQVSAYRYPEAYGLRTPTFSRAALVGLGGGRTTLFISGTASIVGHASVHVGDVRRQTEECLNNIAAVRDVAASRAGLAFPLDALIATVYVRCAGDLRAVREVFERIVGVDSIAAREAIYLEADICRSDLLVEIEAHVMAAGATAA